VTLAVNVPGERGSNESAGKKKKASLFAYVVGGGEQYSYRFLEEGETSSATE